MEGQPYKSYNDPDTGNQLPPFLPVHPLGLHLNVPILRGGMTKAIDFFKIFFTDALLLQICTHANSYAWEAIVSKPYYGDKKGAWKETSPNESSCLIALIMYCGLVTVSYFH